MKRAQIGRYSTREQDLPSERVWAEFRLTDGSAILVDPASEPVEPPEPDALRRRSNRTRSRAAALRWRTLVALRAGAWLFGLGAALQLAIYGHDALSLSPDADIAFLVTREAAFVAVALVPAAILFWRPDAWRSNPALILGASFLALPGIVDQVLWRLINLAPMDPSALWQPYWTLSVAAQVLALPAGLLMLIGLARARTRSDTSWPRILALAVAALTALTTLLIVQSLSEMSQWDPYSGWTPGHVRWWLGQLAVAGQGYLLCLWLGGLAWASISAVRAMETPTILWRCLAVGFASAFAVQVTWFHVLRLVGPIVWQWLDGTVAEGIELWGAIGWALVIAAFIIPGITVPGDRVLDVQPDMPEPAASAAPSPDPSWASDRAGGRTARQPTPPSGRSRSRCR